MARVFYERHALANALGASLNASGWNIGEVRKGFQHEEDIVVPLVSVHFLPRSYLELQLGRSVSADKSFIRRIQVDCYMETEARAMTIGDDVMDFLDSMYVSITDPASTVIGGLYVEDSESILSEVIPPRATEVRVNRWRSTTQATLRADYLV